MYYKNVSLLLKKIPQHWSYSCLTVTMTDCDKNEISKNN